MTTPPGTWWGRHRATVLLACVALAGGLTLGLTAPTTSPVNDPWPAAPSTGPAP